MTAAIAARAELRQKCAPLYCSRERIIILFPGVYRNVNLRELHDSIYGPPDPDEDIVVRLVIAPGALIISRDKRPALRTGTWPEATVCREI